MKHTGRSLAAVVIGTGLLAVTACSSSSGSSATSPAGTPTASSTPSPAPVVFRELSTYLEPVPTGGTRDTDDAWTKTTRPTAAQFVAQFYKAEGRTEQSNELTGEGLQKVAHVYFSNRGVDDDVILLQFATPAGALARYNATVDANSEGRTAVALPGPGEPKGFYDAKADSDHYIRGRSYSHVGRVVVEVFSFSPGTFDQVNLRAVTAAQVKRLPA